MCLDSMQNNGHTCTNFSTSLAGVTVEWRGQNLRKYPGNRLLLFILIILKKGKPSSKTILLNRRIPMHFFRIICKHTGHFSQFSTSVKQLECWTTVYYIGQYIKLQGAYLLFYEFVLNHLRWWVWYLWQISWCHEVQLKDFVKEKQQQAYFGEIISFKVVIHVTKGAFTTVECIQYSKHACKST